MLVVVVVYLDVTPFFFNEYVRGEYLYAGTQYAACNDTPSTPEGRSPHSVLRPR